MDARRTDAATSCVAAEQVLCALQRRADQRPRVTVSSPAMMPALVGSAPMKWLLHPIRRLYCWLGLHVIEVSRSGDPHSAEGSYAYCRHCPWTSS